MSAGAKQAILPFFIPMGGCSYRCVYCDQHSISGQESAPTPAEVAAAALAYEGQTPAELAFYGGSFTALPKEKQLAYLQAAQPALKQGKISSLRISTRPDALSADKLEQLCRWGVSTVELGIQSFAGDVLAKAGRAYSPQQAEQACAMIQQAGLILGIQLMSGLPGDSRELSLFSMRRAISLKPAFMRIYPTLVLKGTPLADLYAKGAYQPQPLGEAAALAGDMLALALAADIPVIRLGLNPSPSLEQALVAGPYHPAFGQLAKGALKLAQACTLLNLASKPRWLLYPPRERPLLFGQKNAQWQCLQQLYPQLSAKAAPLPPGSLGAISEGGQEQILRQEDFLPAYGEVLG